MAVVECADNFVLRQSCLLSSYTFPKYLSGPSDDDPDSGPHTVSSVTFVAPSTVQQDTIADEHVKCNATAHARDMATERADVATPEFMARQAREVRTRTAEALCKLCITIVKVVMCSWCVLNSLRGQIAAAFPDNMTCSVMEQQELLDSGLNLLAAVGQGAHRSTHTPRLVTLEYRGNPSEEAVDLALVGKVRGSGMFAPPRNV